MLYGTFCNDIEILVVFDRPLGFFKFLELEEHLSELLGLKVDLVTRASLNPYIRSPYFKRGSDAMKRDYRDYIQDILHLSPKLPIHEDFGLDIAERRTRICDDTL